jgi:hypothetical protein
LTFSSAEFGGSVFSAPGSWLLVDGSSLTGSTPSVVYNFVQGLSGLVPSLNIDALNGDIRLVLTASTLNGDFDSDGDVDGADFIAWQTNFPTASGATPADGDADGDTDVDGADFAAWQSGYPTSPGPGASPVPEPSTCMSLLIFVITALLALQGKHFKRA